MFNLVERLKQAKGRLQSVQTRITLETGQQICEERTKTGEFAPVIAGEVGDATGKSVDGSEAPIISNRRKKIVERCLRYGYVVDLKPDLQLANVAKGLFLGSQDVAADFQLLKSAGITHVINAATCVKNFFPSNFTYLTLKVLDVPSQNLRVHFDEAIEFIQNALANDGKVFVHCNAGISRSSTLAIAYIMFFERKSLQDALGQVKAVRTVARPNDGFMRQLQEYEKELNLNSAVLL